VTATAGEGTLRGLFWEPTDKMGEEGSPKAEPRSSLLVLASTPPLLAGE
jgi:hypothetical protein